MISTALHCWKIHSLARRNLFKLSRSFADMSPNDAGRISVGIIVIGDEILKGSTKDSNSYFMCKRLHDRGVIVRKISVIGDGVDEIAEEVKKFSCVYDFVFTSGGIGPTHDDRTFAGVAQAFDDELSANDELRSILEVFLRRSKLKDVSGTAEKFSKIPKSAKLIWGSIRTSENETNRFPFFQVRNVVVLPGVPRLCEQSFAQLEEVLFPSSKCIPFFSKSLYLKKNEIHLHENLTKIAEKYDEAGVTIGSYPVLDSNYFKTKLIVESSSNECGDNAYRDLISAFSDFIVNCDEAPWANSNEKLKVFCDTQPEEFCRKIREAMETIDKVLNEYGMDQMSLSFNGGKDCTILLHLLRCRFDERYGPDAKIQGFHIISNDGEFPQLSEFISGISSKYNLEMRKLKGSQKSGLEQLKAEQPSIVAVFMGSRSTDPAGRFMKSNSQWTDKDWPHFFRVCPVFDLTYTEVWKALRGLNIPYCSLYDRGYTSLGKLKKTHQNPALLVPGETDKYLPAFRLENDCLERLSRD